MYKKLFVIAAFTCCTIQAEGGCSGGNDLCLYGAGSGIVMMASSYFIKDEKMRAKVFDVGLGVFLTSGIIGVTSANKKEYKRKIKEEAKIRRLYQQPENPLSKYFIVGR